MAVIAAFLAADRVLGARAAPLFGAALFAFVVVLRPKLALFLVLVSAVMIEDTGEGGLFPGLARFYSGAPLSPFEGLVVLAVAASVLDVARRREARMPDPLTLPLLMIIAAIVSGVVVGTTGGAPVKEVLFTLRPLLALIAIPFVVVNCLRTREEILDALKLAVGLVAIKALIGIYEVVSGHGYSNPPDPSITYLAPATNFLAMAFLLIVPAALWRRRKADIWLLAITALTFVSLLLSYRRSFWIATVAGALIVVLVGASRLRLRVMVPGAAVIVAALWLTLSTGVVSDVSGPIATRAASLNPNKIEVNAQDNYRIGERQNVLIDIGHNPVTGLGLAVPWTGRYPPSVDRPGSRDYVHFAALWWWLKLGLLGLVSYLWLMAAGLWTSYRLWRESSDPWLKPLGLGLLGTTLGLVLAETTAAFTGVTTRFSVVLAATLGLAAAGLALSRRQADAAPGGVSVEELQ